MSALSPEDMMHPSTEEAEKEERTQLTGSVIHPEDPVILAIGNFGRWQALNFFLLSCLVVLHAWQMFSMKFLAFPVDHWCQRPKEFLHLNIEEWRNISAPLSDDISQTFDKCSVFDLSDGRSPYGPVNKTAIPCSSWEYDSSHFRWTIMERWDLVCSAAFLPRLAQTLFFLGNMIGVFFCGILADRFGRKTTMMQALSLLIVAGALGSVVKNFYVWCAVRFTVGAATLSMNTCIAVYIAENCSAKYRPLYHALTSGLGWTLGHISLGLLVYLIPNMIHLELFMACCFVLFLPLWWVLPESPRWLIAKRREKEATKVIKHICKMNRRPMPAPSSLMLSKEIHDEASKGTIWDLLKTPGIRRNFLAMCFCWLSFSMGYFGLIYNTPAKQGSVYWVFILPGLLGIPACFILPWCQHTFGRKGMLSVPLIVAGVVLLATLALPKDLAVLLTVFSIAGTMSCGAAFDTGYLFTKELFPTVLRTTALSSASAAARIGSLLSPLIGALDSVDSALPLAVYGCIVLGAGLISILIWPETKFSKLPDSVAEAEKMASTRNSWTHCTCCPCCKEHV